MIQMILTCGPAAVMMAGTLASSVSKFQEGASASKAADYNADNLRNQARDTLQIGAIEAADKRQKARQVGAQQAEAMAGAGMSINTGTPLGILVQTAGAGELDALRTMDNARREAWGLKTQADLEEIEGDNAFTGASLSAFGTLLGGASSTYFKTKAVK